MKKLITNFFNNRNKSKIKSKEVGNKSNETIINDQAITLDINLNMIVDYIPKSLTNEAFSTNINLLINKVNNIKELYKRKYILRNLINEERSNILIKKQIKASKYRNIQESISKMCKQRNIDNEYLKEKDEYELNLSKKLNEFEEYILRIANTSNNKIKNNLKNFNIKEFYEDYHNNIMYKKELLKSIKDIKENCNTQSELNKKLFVDNIDKLLNKESSFSSLDNIDNKRIIKPYLSSSSFYLTDCNIKDVKSEQKSYLNTSLSKIDFIKKSNKNLYMTKIKNIFYNNRKIKLKKEDNKDKINLNIRYCSPNYTIKNSKYNSSIDKKHKYCTSSSNTDKTYKINKREKIKINELDFKNNANNKIIENDSSNLKNKKGFLSKYIFKRKPFNYKFSKKEYNTHKYSINPVKKLLSYKRKNKLTLKNNTNLKININNNKNSDVGKTTTTTTTATTTTIATTTNTTTFNYNELSTANSNIKSMNKEDTLIHKLKKLKKNYKGDNFSFSDTNIFDYESKNYLYNDNLNIINSTSNNKNKCSIKINTFDVYINNDSNYISNNDITVINESKEDIEENNTSYSQKL